mgnify:CR=1 FL=1
MSTPPNTPAAPRWHSARPWFTWLVGWALMLALAPRLDLANLAMMLVQQQAGTAQSTCHFGAMVSISAPV